MDPSIHRQATRIAKHTTYTLSSQRRGNLLVERPRRRFLPLQLLEGILLLIIILGTLILLIDDLERPGDVFSSILIIVVASTLAFRQEAIRSTVDALGCFLESAALVDGLERVVGNGSGEVLACHSGVVLEVCE